MPIVNTSELIELQKNTANIRNICIIAHVDHGKTTLSDVLISANGIISAKSSGKLRYLDSRQDEQERGITMKSSAITLMHQQRSTNQQFLINLIDSPGHVDFSGEVTSALRITDGALVLVDVIEGVCIQTVSVLRQAWDDRVKPCLVLNKIDRLITKLQMTPEEAYVRIKQVLEQANAVIALLYKEDLLREDALKSQQQQQQQQREEIETNSQQSAQQFYSLAQRKAKRLHDAALISEQVFDWSIEEKDDSDLYFAPEHGNVIFASAIDGWGFRLDHFASLYAEKLGMKREVLQQTLWGDFYYSAKKKKIFKDSQGGTLQPMFVQFVLNNIWQLYQATVIDKDKDKTAKIIAALRLTIPLSEVQNNDPVVKLQAIARRWLPLADAVLDMCVDKLPSPIEAQRTRIDKLWRPLPAAASDEMRHTYDLVRKALLECQADSEVVVAFVSKVFFVSSGAGDGRTVLADGGPRVAMPKPRTRAPNAAPTASAETVGISFDAVGFEPASSSEEATATKTNGAQQTDSSATSSQATKTGETAAEQQSGSGERFVALARIFCGTLRRGSRVHVLGPRFDPLQPDKYRTEMSADELLLLMGRSLEPLAEVPAGCVLGIGRVEAHILKTATLSTTPLIPTFTPINLAKPIVRVAVEPRNPSQTQQLIEALKRLNQADPAVEVLVQETGEHIIKSTGEVHLERCLRDMRELFGAPLLIVSPPLVGMRETITADLAKQTITSGGDAIAEVATNNRLLTVRVSALPLPAPVVAFLESHTEQMRRIFVERAASKESAEFIAFQQQLVSVLLQCGHKWAANIDKIWSFGPKRVGANILFNCTLMSQSKYWRSVCSAEEAQTLKAFEVTQTIETNQQANEESESDTRSIEMLRALTMEVEEESGMDKWTLLQLLELEPAIINGFQLATAAGPLCEEPMTGIAFFVESLTVGSPDDFRSNDKQSPMRGQVLSAVREACRQAYLRRSPRLVEPMYLCDIQVPAEKLGNTYEVLGKHRCKIRKEDLREGTDVFVIEALLPVIESFGFAEELRSWTGGAAAYQFRFHSWEPIAEDPFFVPITEDEIEEFGHKMVGAAPNLARKLMNDVRKRKGLFVADEKIVESAEKQRTLSKNK